MCWQMIDGHDFSYDEVYLWQVNFIDTSLCNQEVFVIALNAQLSMPGLAGAVCVGR